MFDKCQFYVSLSYLKENNSRQLDSSLSTEIYCVQRRYMIHSAIFNYQFLVFYNADYILSQCTLLPWTETRHDSVFLLLLLEVWISKREWLTRYPECFNRPRPLDSYFYNRIKLSFYLILHYTATEVDKTSLKATWANEEKYTGIPREL